MRMIFYNFKIKKMNKIAQKMLTKLPEKINFWMKKSLIYNKTRLISDQKYLRNRTNTNNKERQYN